MTTIPLTERAIVLRAEADVAIAKRELARGSLLADGQATIEVGTSTDQVTVTELNGEERDRVYAEQVKRMPGFGDYERKTEGIRKIPVLRLTRR